MHKTQNNFKRQNSKNTNDEPKNLLIPKTDIVFQTLFSKGHENITIPLVSSLINEQVDSINMDVDSVLKRQHVDDKLGIVDFRAKLGNGTYCNIEIQLIKNGDVLKRFLFYWAKIFSNHLKIGDDYDILPRTISIAILDFNLNELKDIPEFYTSWKIIEEKYRKKTLTSLFDFRIIELPKLKESTNKQLHDRLTQWMLFLDNPKSMEVKKIMKTNVDIQKAIDTLEEISSDKELMRLVELREKAIHDEISLRNYAEKQGMEKGLKKGLEQGRKEGKKEGKKESCLEIAKNLLKKGIDIGTIQDVTGLTKKEIELL